MTTDNPSTLAEAMALAREEHERAEENAKRARQWHAQALIFEGELQRLRERAKAKLDESLTPAPVTLANAGRRPTRFEVGPKTYTIKPGQSLNLPGGAAAITVKD